MADSINLDPHKALNMPIGIGTLLVRDGRTLKHAMSSCGSSFRTSPNEDDNSYSPVDYTFELSRPARALPIWYALRLMGVATVRLFLQEKLDLATQIYTQVRAMGCFRVKPDHCPLDLPILLFRYDGGDYDESRTTGLLYFINNDYRLIIRHVIMDGLTWIRVVTYGYRTHSDHVELLLDLIKKNTILTLQIIQDVILTKIMLIMIDFMFTTKKE